MQNFMKLNVDDVFYVDDLHGSTRVVIHDTQDTFIAVSSSKAEHVHDVLSAEVQALKARSTPGTKCWVQ
jgi:hypothetical protein